MVISYYKPICRLLHVIGIIQKTDRKSSMLSEAWLLMA